MKRYNRNSYMQNLQDLKDCPPFHLDVGCEGVEGSFTEPFTTGIKPRVITSSYAHRLIDLAKTVDKAYSRVGVLDLNDIIQEYNAAFLVAWNRIGWERVKEIPEEERQYYVWAYLKKSARLDVKNSIRNLKDGIRVPLYKYRTGEALGFITRIFPQLFENQFFTKDVSKYEQDVLADFIEITLDKYLDRTFKGERSSGIERNVIALSFGLDGIDKMSLKRIGKKYGKSVTAISEIKRAALKKLRDEETSDWVEESFKECVAAFVVAEEIATNSEAYDFYKKISKSSVKTDLNVT